MKSILNISNSSLFFWILVFVLFLSIFVIVALFIKNKDLKKNIDSLNRLIEEKEKNIKLLEQLKNNRNEEKIEKKKEEVRKIEVEKKEIEEKNPEVKSEEKQNLYNTKFKPTRVVPSPVGIKKESENNIKKEERKEENKASSLNYMKEVSEKLEKAVSPSTIELTDYERKQEEEAIISYKELIENKDKLYNITDDEEDIDFIEELKNFRDDLE